jgi:hypothetical protein
VVTVPRRVGPLIPIKTRNRLGILQLYRIQGPAPKSAEYLSSAGALTLPAALGVGRDAVMPLDERRRI